MIKNTSKNEESDYTFDEMEALYKSQLLNAYNLGANRGAKCFLRIIYDILIEDKKHETNPALTLKKVEENVEGMLGISDESDD